VEPETISLRVAQGVEVHAQLFVKPGVPGRRPGVVYVHGGPQRQMFPAWHSMEYYLRAYALNQYLASRGFLVLSVNFRGGTGYGRGYRFFARAPDRIRAAHEDAVAAATYLRNRREVDPARIGVWGGSYGGYLTALVLADNSDLFAAGVDLHGVSDVNAFHRDLGLIHGWDPADQKLAHSVSPVADLSRWRSPVLLIHGDHDSIVRFSQSADLAQRLSALPRPPEVETLLLPDEVHLILRFSSWVTGLGAAAEFLERRLGPALQR
jgi:dipeptidyl aminopeptidase/acylaminoacyl peptidase